MATLQLELFPDTRPTRSGPAEVFYKRSSSILNRGVGKLSGVDFTLNPYVGCQFGCAYCYAAFFHPDKVRVAQWGKWVQVKENALDLVRRSRLLPGATLMIGTATDCYQPVEAKLGLTRSILEHLATLRPQPRITLITRSPIVERDIDVFRRLNSFSVHISITTDDEEVRKAFEPGCASIRRRLQTLETLAKAGVRVGANLAPLLPTRDPIGLLHRVKDLGAGRAWIQGFLEGSGPFSSSTRDKAKKIAAELHWTPEQSEAIVTRLKEEAETLFHAEVTEQEEHPAGQEGPRGARSSTESQRHAIVNSIQCSVGSPVTVKLSL